VGVTDAVALAGVDRVHEDLADDLRLADAPTSDVADCRLMSETDSPDTCARCGGTIDDDDDVILVVFEAEERDFDPDDPGPVRAAYCETCTRAIQEAHEGHDEEVAVFRHELERFGRP
jgi:hypothetical protein